MSPHAANSLVHDLVQMAQAMEELPKVREQLEATQLELAEWQRRYDGMSEDLVQSRTYAASLEQRVHDLEVARDDAELSFLEADERTSRALDFVKALFGNAGALIQALEPPKAAAPDERAMGEPSSTGSMPLGGGLSEAIANASEAIANTPLAAQLDSHPVGEHSAAPSSAYASDGTISPGEAAGQREPDPTTTVTGPVDQSQAFSSISAQGESAPQTREAPPVGLYHGANYYEWPSYVEYDRWIAGGGTEWDYYNRRPAANRY